MNPEQMLEQKCINTIRFLAIDAIQKANSGHPGMPMGCAPMAHVLFSEVMNHSPKNPNWWGRDRFVLSAGHGSMLLYSLLHLSGYDLSMEDLKQFRQWQSRTPGHPEYGHTPGVETTTGPLGQGVANMVGMAMAEANLAQTYNRPGLELFNHFIYGIAGDGCMMEGISHEAASFAGHQKLGKLVLFYDANQISIDGPLALTMSEEVGRRFEAYGWHVQLVDDVNDVDSLRRAILKAQNETSAPSLIITKSQIGFGSPNKAGKSSAHGSPLGEEEVRLTRENLGWEQNQTFFVPSDVSDFYSQVPEKGKNLELAWQEKWVKYQTEYPKEAAELKERMDGKSSQWLEHLPSFESGKALATRAASGAILEAIGPHHPALIGGSADLTPSNNTRFSSVQDFSSEDRTGRYVRFGVREHAMGAMMNGMAMHGGMVPYGGTFLVFSDYMRPAIRIAALSGVRTIYVFTHDSIGLGEDGPTHQPVEHLASLRVMPNVTVFRPADANETAQAWKYALNHQDGPVALLLSRQKLPTLDREVYQSADATAKGFYVLKDWGDSPELIILASGSEVEIAIEAADQLYKAGNTVRVVSCPSWELFEAQDAEYQASVLPDHITKRISIEAGSTLGWERYTGRNGIQIGLVHFGASAPGDVLFREFGFTVERVVEMAGRL